MKQIPITILAEDIKTTSFGDFNNCAITRAVKRAGVNGFHAGFDEIVNSKSELIANLESQEISDCVIHMYNHEHPEKYMASDTKEPEDIHTFITLTED